MVAAVMLAKDEADIIRFNLERLREQVDHVYVSDDGSTDGTQEILRELSADGDWLSAYDCEDPAYYQSKKTTALAMRALSDGYRWVVPVDADEFWYAPDGRLVKQMLEGLAPDVQFVRAELYDHVPTAADPPAHCATCGDSGELLVASGYITGFEVRRDEEGGWTVCPHCQGEVQPNPFRRIRWRKREHGALPKVACRLRPDLIIDAGNHSASSRGTGLTSSGLVVRHFSWRSESQYQRKIRNGERAYKLTDLPESVGAHWRMWEGHPDEVLHEHFRTWFWSPDPHLDDTLIYDPAPGA